VGSAPAFCPHCSAALKSQRFGEAIPVITQVCPNRHGRWLDRGKLRSIKQFHDSPVESPPEDDITPEEIDEIVLEGDGKRAHKRNPISGKASIKQKGLLILLASLLLAVALPGLIFSWTPNTLELRAISQEFIAQSAQDDNSEIAKSFSTDMTEGISIQEAPIQQEPRTPKNSAANKSTSTMSQTQLTQKELQDKALAKRIDKYLASRKSPMAGTGSIFVAAGNSTGVSPLLSVAIAGKESSFGLYCFAPHNAFGMLAPAYRNGFASWEKAIWANSRYLLSHFGKVSSPYQCPGYCVPDHPWMEDVASLMNAI